MSPAPTINTFAACTRDRQPSSHPASAAAPVASAAGFRHFGGQFVVDRGKKVGFAEISRVSGPSLEPLADFAERAGPLLPPRHRGLARGFIVARDAKAGPLLDSWRPCSRKGLDWGDAVGGLGSRTAFSRVPFAQSISPGLGGALVPSIACGLSSWNGGQDAGGSSNNRDGSGVVEAVQGVAEKEVGADLTTNWDKAAAQASSDEGKAYDAQSEDKVGGGEVVYGSDLQGGGVEDEALDEKLQLEEIAHLNDEDGSGFICSASLPTDSVQNLWFWGAIWM
ncbi:hypothetical protein GUJ93_ZPchr0005g14698 [Zizania palustris]|uniref:Uncharacterized protein n=1 Tax=Zizania palustris TaxID=103762 RepID=A0A8J5T9F2_ZIZPA|nr:hypothetical protein GUJ93_ZPchr0005g14698 [Zizania palustris]